VDRSAQFRPGTCPAGGFCRISRTWTDVANGLLLQASSKVVDSYYHSGSHRRVEAPGENHP
jgi:hypothetical protein